MARVSGASTLAWLWRLRRLLSDAQRAPTQSSVSRMLLLSPVAMGIGCLRKQELTLPCCSSGYTTHGASSFLSSGIKFSPCTRRDQCFSAYSEKIVDFDRKAKLEESISAAFISNTAPYTTEEWDPKLVVSDGSSWSQQYQSTSQLECKFLKDNAV